MRSGIRFISFLTAFIMLISVRSAYALSAAPTPAAEPVVTTVSLFPILEEWLSETGEHRVAVVDWTTMSVMTSETPAPASEPTQTAEPDIRCIINTNTETAEALIGIINTYEKNKYLVVYLAQYDEDGILIGVKAEEIEVPALTAAPAEYTVRPDIIMENLKYIRVFVWDKMVPVRPFT